MNTPKKWQILNTLQDKKIKTDDLINLLLANRGITTKKDKELFFSKDLSLITPKFVGIDTQELQKALKRITQAVEQKEQIIIFGDYDVDGICGTAILWETLHGLGAEVSPYIPSRIDEGYGLSVAGIENVLQKYPKTHLIITVDNGIVANSAVDFAREKGIDVVISDHHVPSEVLPKALAIVHTTKLCGTGVAYLFSQELIHQHWVSDKIRSAIAGDDHLSLVALATVADLVPLIGGNRILLKNGLDALHTSNRSGIVALVEEAGIIQKSIGVYEIGHMLAPRLNAMGRIASAMDSLRLLCTKDRLKAKVFAEKLGITNKERQELTKSLSLHAIDSVNSGKTKLQNLLVVSDERYEEGVIGLIAGKLVEQFYRPAIVVSVGEKISKASARSVVGFNIIEFIRTAEHLLINAGGHPMAAGFTVYTEKIEELKNHFTKQVNGLLTQDLLQRILKIDCTLSLENISQEIYNTIQTLSPFGMSNAEPVFASSAKIISLRLVGQEKKHLSLQLQQRGKIFSAIAFGMGEIFQDLEIGQEIEIAYTIDEHEWKNKKSLQLKIKDIKRNNY